MYRTLAHKSQSQSKAHKAGHNNLARAKGQQKQSQEPRNKKHAPSPPGLEISLLFHTVIQKAGLNQCAVNASSLGSEFNCACMTRSILQCCCKVIRSWSYVIVGFLWMCCT